MSNQQPFSDDQLDNWLDARPLAPLPEAFAVRLMAQVQPREQPIPAIQFRLHFIDWVVPLFLSLFTFFVFEMGLWLTGVITPAWLPAVGETAVSQLFHTNGLTLAFFIALIGEAAIGLWIYTGLYWDRSISV